MDEKQAIAECLQGKTESFKLIVEAYAKEMMALALGLLGNYQDAEDICQETFVQAFRNLHRYDPAKNFRNWLLAILYHRSIDFQRKRSRWRHFLNQFSKYLPKTSSFISKNSGENISGETKIQDPVLQFLGILTTQERAALTLWAFEDLSSQEIAEVMGCRPSTVRVHLYLARRKIKSWLEGKKERKKA